MIHGKNLILTINSPYAKTTALAAAKTCDVDLKTDFIEVASPTEGGWKNYIPTINSWGLSAGLLLATPATYNMLFDYQTSKTMLTARFFLPDFGLYYKGNTYISNLKITGNVGSLVSISVSFQPTGSLTPSRSNTISCDSEQVGKTIEWSNGAPVRIITDATGYSLKYKELTLTAAKTYIKTTHPTTIIFREEASSVITKIYQGVSMSDLLSTAVLVDGVGGKSVIVDSGTYTVLLNGENQNTPDGTYVSTI